MGPSRRGPRGDTGLLARPDRQGRRPSRRGPRGEYAGRPGGGHVDGGLWCWDAWRVSRQAGRRPVEAGLVVSVQADRKAGHVDAGLVVLEGVRVQAGLVGQIDAGLAVRAGVRGQPPGRTLRTLAS